MPATSTTKPQSQVMSYRQAIEQSDVVLALDVTTGRYTVVYGKQIVDHAFKTKSAIKNTFELACEPGTYEFELLLNLVESVKGHHEWSGV